MWFRPFVPFPKDQYGYEDSFPLCVVTVFLRQWMLHIVHSAGVFVALGDCGEPQTLNLDNESGTTMESFSKISEGC